MNREVFEPSQWVVDQANFDAFMATMEADEEFRNHTNDLMNVIENEKDPYVKHAQYWNHNQWLHDNNYVHIKDALWDYIEGRR